MDEQQSMEDNYIIWAVPKHILCFLFCVLVANKNY